MINTVLTESMPQSWSLVHGHHQANRVVQIWTAQYRNQTEEGTAKLSGSSFQTLSQYDFRAALSSDPGKETFV